MRRILLATVLVAGVLGSALSMLTPAGAGQSSLADVRAATAAFHDVPTAEAAGYEPLLSCFSSPQGGMGQHLVNTSRLDANLDPTHPEALVYEVDGSRLQLVAVEYIVPLTAWQSLQPPRVLNHDLHLLPALGLWVLHAWIWRPNPNGMFVDYNPAVRRCP